MAFLQSSSINNWLKVTGSNTDSYINISSSKSGGLLKLLFGQAGISLSTIKNLSSDANLLFIKHHTSKLLTLTKNGLIIIGHDNVQSGSIRSTNISNAQDFNGSGFTINNNASNKWQICTDLLVVRGSMRVYLLIINQIRATNGALFVTDAGKAISGSGTLSSGSTNVVVNFLTSSYLPFMANDIIRAQRFNFVNGAQATLYQIDLLVTTTNFANSAVTCSVMYNSGFTIDNFKGALFVRIGNTTNADRQGYIFLNSLQKPYIDIANDVSSSALFNSNTTRKVRLGYLGNGTASSGGTVSSSVFGALNGWGFYTQNGYLLGGINAVTGLIGGWNINLSTLSKNSVTLDSAGKIYIGTGTFGNTNTSFYADKDGQFSLKDKLTFSDSVLSVDGVITSSAGSIGGWQITPGKLSSGLTSLNTSSIYWATANSVPAPTTSSLILSKSAYVVPSHVILVLHLLLIPLLSGTSSAMSYTTNTNVTIILDYVITCTLPNLSSFLLIWQTTGSTSASIAKINLQHGSKQRYIPFNFNIASSSNKIIYKYYAGNTGTVNVNSNTITIQSLLLNVNSYSTVSLLSNRGLLIFNNPSSYVKIGSDNNDKPVFKFATLLITVKDLNVIGDLYTNGTVYASANNLLGTTAKRFRVNTDATSTALLVSLLLWSSTTNQYKIYADDATGIKFDCPISASNMVNTSRTLTITASNGLTGSAGYNLSTDRIWTLGLTGQALALHNATSSNGFFVRSGSNIYQRLITGVANRTTITSGSGAAANPIIDIASTYVGQTSIVTLGTVLTGSWSATTIAVDKGGTGQTTYTNGLLLIGSGSSLAKGNITCSSAKQIAFTRGSGSITLALPQDIATDSNVTFATLNCTTLNLTSLRLYKTNITLLDSYQLMLRLFKLRPITYNPKLNIKLTLYGFIALLMLQIYPLIAAYDLNNKLQGIKYQRLVVPIISTLKRIYRLNLLLKYRLLLLLNSRFISRVKRLVRRILNLI